MAKESAKACSSARNWSSLAVGTLGCVGSMVVTGLRGNRSGGILRVGEGQRSTPAQTTAGREFGAIRNWSSREILF